MRRILAFLFLTTACHKETAKPGPLATTPTPSACDASAIEPLATDASSSPLALGRLGKHRVAILADEDDAALRVVDLEHRRVLTTFALGTAPGHVVITRGGRVHVSLPRVDAVAELALDAEGAMTECARQSTPPEPIALALADDDATLLVASRRGRALTLFRAGTAPRTIGLSRDPEGVLVEGPNAVVAHRVGSIVSVVSLDQRVVAREVSFAWRDRIGLPSLNGRPIADMPRFAVQAHALSRIKDHVEVPMVLAYPGETHLEVTITSGYGAASIQGVDGYFPHEPAVASLAPDGTSPRLHVRGEVIEERGQRLSTGRVAFREPCLLPRSVATDGESSYIACLGIDQLLFMRDGVERARVALPSGPTAVAVDPVEREAIVWSQFARAVSLVNLDQRTTSSVPIAAERPLDPAEADGRKTFHAPIAFDGRACASCHPDGLDDGLVWSSPLGPMQPPVLAGRLEGTAPYGWLGGAPTIPGHLKSTLMRMQAKPLPETTMNNLVAFLRAMATPEKHALTAVEKRGRDVFTAEGCDGCHASEGRGSDGMPHDVGTGGNMDTPSLVSVGRSAPYMHDGRFATLREAIVKTAGTMGPKSLAESDLDALVAYLKKL